MTPVEISIKVSDDEQTLTQKHLFYPDNVPLSISHDDPQLAPLVQEAIKSFQGQAQDVVVKFKYVW